MTATPADGTPGADGMHGVDGTPGAQGGYGGRGVDGDHGRHRTYGSDGASGASGGPPEVLATARPGPGHPRSATMPGDGAAPASSARLSCRQLSGGRGAATAFRDLDLEVAAGTVLALLGPNGAGKTTLLMTIAGLLPAQGGSSSVDGTTLRNGNPVAATRAGVVLVPDNRCLFTTLSVEENLQVARRRNGPAPRDLLEVFPALEKRWQLPAGALSGGEQQMLALARALIQQPRVLLVDEMSMGLAPLVVETLFDTVRRIASEHGAAIVLVEQHVTLALRVADEAAVLNRGAIVLRGRADELRNQGDRLERAYFGAEQGVAAGSPG